MERGEGRGPEDAFGQQQGGQHDWSKWESSWRGQEKSYTAVHVGPGCRFVEATLKTLAFDCCREETMGRAGRGDQGEQPLHKPW